MTNGVIFYQGPSMIDGKPIVAIAVGLKQGSTNTKTGAMIQTYILRADKAPTEAVRDGSDESICGSCVHRGDGTGKQRSCYVTLIHGPQNVWRAFQNGRYPMRSWQSELFRDRMVRMGTYGDPAAVPIAYWRNMLKHAKGWTGYTHQWKNIHWRWRELVMASADTVEEMAHAHVRGFRTFRVTPVGEGPLKGLEFNCPASHEAGQKLNCIDCMACMGTSAPHKASVQIAAHGAGRNHVG